MGFFLDNGIWARFRWLAQDSSDGWGGRESYGYGECTFGDTAQ